MATTTNGIYYPNDYNAAADIPSDLKTMAESIDKNIQDNKYNDTEIKKDIQNLESDVSDIKSNQTTQNDLLERTQSALINITTEKSSNINVKDSSDLNAKIDVYGISEQETREGYNLFNNTKKISNVTYNSEEDKWIFNFTGRYDHIASKGDFFEDIKANTNYTMYLNILKNTTNGIITFNSGNTIWNTSFNIQAGQTGVVVNNIKTREDLSTALYDLWFSHPNTITGEFEVQIMLVEGTFTLQNIPNYEKYGASPSPEFPSDIENVTGDIDITVCNKNLAKIVDSIAKSYITMNGDGTFTINGTLQNNEAFSYIMNQPFKKGKYRLSLGIDYNNFNNSYHNIASNNGSEVIKFFNHNDTNFEIQEDCAITASIVLIAGTYNNLVVKPMIERTESEISSDFVKHEEQLITFPLKEGQRLADGDKLASDGIHHVRDTYTFKAVTSLASYNNNRYGTNVGAVNSINTANILSDRIIGSDTTKENTGYITGGGETVVIYGNPTDTVKSFNEKFVGTKIEYPLAKEKIEPYTEEQQEAYNKLQSVLSYYNETNVFTDKALLEFKYIADTQTWVLNKINNTNQQILELAGGK